MQMVLGFSGGASTASSAQAAPAPLAASTVAAQLQQAMAGSDKRLLERRLHEAQAAGVDSGLLTQGVIRLEEIQSTSRRAADSSASTAPPPPPPPPPPPLQAQPPSAAAEPASSAGWQALFQRASDRVPTCRHNEPCKKQTTKKAGPNQGKMFYSCARPEGPRSNREANCGYFKWASDWSAELKRKRE